MARMDGIFNFWKTKEAPGVVLPDLYAILGVSPAASAGEIRSAYRQMAMKFHPDRNPDDERAYEKYIEITKAHEILSDPEKRDRYDRVKGPRESGPRGGEGRGLSTYIQPSRRRERPAGPGPSMPEAVKPAKKKPTLVELIAPERGSEYEGPLSYESLRPSPRRQQRSLEEVYFAEEASVEMPSRETLLEAVQQLDLPKIWDFIRKYRQDPGFLEARSIVIGPVGPPHSRSIGEDLAWISGADLEEVTAFIQAKGLERAWDEVLRPLAEQTVLALDHSRPADVPGNFIMNWEPSGNGLELIYVEPGK